MTTPYGAVEVKIGSRRGELWQWSPEYESCRERAEAAGVPWKEVFASALARRGAGSENG